MHRTLLHASALLVAIALTGCAANSSPTLEKPSTPAEQARTDVDWDNYSPATQDLIDQSEANAECASLQKAFDAAAEPDDVQRARSGDGNADLMAYIDEALQSAACYE